MKEKRIEEVTNWIERKESRGKLLWRRAKVAMARVPVTKKRTKMAATAKERQTKTMKMKKIEMKKEAATVTVTVMPMTKAIKITCN